jgi:mgtE-like transporter
MARAGRDRRPGDRGGPRGVGAYLADWRAEAGSVRASLVALSVGLGATLVAGTVLAAAADRISAVPGLLALIPAAIGMRGSTFGALASRLSTGILTGEYRPGALRRGWLGRQVRAVAVLSVVSSVQAGVLAWLVATAVGLATVGPLALVAVSLLGGVAASTVLLVVVLGLARRSSRRGWSLDDVAAPLVSATGDLVTLPALLAATAVLGLGRGVADVIGGAGLALGVVLAVVGVSDRDPRIRRLLRESLAVLTIAVGVDVLAGVAIEVRLEQQFTSASLLVMLPPFVAKCGALGGMLASRLSSRLHVGTLEPTRWPGPQARLDLSLTVLFATVTFTGVGASAWLAATLVPGVAPLPVATMLAVALLAGALAVPILSSVAYAAATVSFRHGYDPDNHGIPIVTSTMDLAGVLCLVAAVTLLQVGG